MTDSVTANNESWWQSNRRTKETIDFLQETAEDVATSRTIDSDARAEAITVAKRLAVDLGEAGFAESAQLANGVIATLDHAGLPQPERLQQQVSALRASLESALAE